MSKIFVITLLALVAFASAVPLGEGLLGVGKGLLGGTGNLIGVEADAHANIAGQEVGLEGAAGIGEDGIGAHGAGAADILGQQAGTHADLLGGVPGGHGHGHRRY